MTEVVLTGIGTVGPFGAGRRALADALAAGADLSAALDRSAGFHRRGGGRRALFVPPAALGELVPPALARRMGYPSRLAVAATRLALSDAGLDEKDAGFADAAIVMSTAFGPVRVTEQLFDAIFHHGPEQASPALFTESVASAPASQMALLVKAHGPNLTITEREAGPLMAVTEGTRLIARGRAARVLVGAVEEVTPLLHSTLDRFHALCTPDANGVEVARPFDRVRRGALAAEGATVLLLESAEVAAARGARPLALVRAGWGGFDPASPPYGWSTSPDPLARKLCAGLARHGLAPSTIDRLVAGASGSIRGDQLEGIVLREAFGAGSLPPILCPKGTVGEFGGGFLAAVALAATGDAAWPTAGFREIDPLLGLRPHDGSPLPPPTRLLASAFAAGGAAAWLVLDRA